MAKVDIKMPDDFLNKLQNLGSYDDAIAERALEAGAEVVESKVRSNLASVIGRGTKTESRSTGQLLSALGVSGVRLDREGNHNVKIGFAEGRTDGESNAKLANILEYGKHGQPAKPFLKLLHSSNQVSLSNFPSGVRKFCLLPMLTIIKPFSEYLQWSNTS